MLRGAVQTKGVHLRGAVRTKRTKGVQLRSHKRGAPSRGNILYGWKNAVTHFAVVNGNDPISSLRRVMIISHLNCIGG